MVEEFNREYFVVFIKFKTPFDIDHIFEGVNTLIQVIIHHNHSTTLTTRAGYIRRAHQKFRIKQKYEEILRNYYFQAHREEVEINARKSKFADGVFALRIFIDKNKVEEIKETFNQKRKN